MRKCECLTSCIVAFVCTLAWYRILGYNLNPPLGLKPSTNVVVALRPLEQGQLPSGDVQTTGEVTTSSVGTDTADVENDNVNIGSANQETPKDSEETPKDNEDIRVTTTSSSPAPDIGEADPIQSQVPLLLESGSYWPRFSTAARKKFHNPCRGRKFVGPIVGTGPLRFFIYPLPAEMVHASDIKKLDKTTQMNRAFEPAVHKVMENHPARTLDPEEASFFVIPAHLSCVANVWLSQSGGGPVCGPCNSLERKIIDFMNKFGKYWSRNGGIDHIVSSYTCPRPYDKLPFHQLWPRGSSDSLRCGPIELCLRTKSRESVDEFRSVKVPYHIPDSDYPDLTKPIQKDISVYFAGSYLALLGNKRQPIVAALPKIPGGVSFVFDRKLFNKWPSEKQNQVLADMSRNYSRAQFIAVPQGDTTVESRRTYQAIANGCVPIVLTGKFGPNLPEALDWSEFAVSYDLDVLFDKEDKSGLSHQEFERRHKKSVEERINAFIKGMSSISAAQIKHLQQGLLKNRNLLRYGDDGKGGLGTAILKALERRREAFKR